ncbi:hypothetical protein KSP40_PGU013087 [Platanthera guangdongensis]|uniref:Uncharacterized protein n=1 Tax=Platanthera guangdongensis TaxID=2320717 RepID=A0ABR2MUE6_9ASPA
MKLKNLFPKSFVPFPRNSEKLCYYEENFSSILCFTVTDIQTTVTRLVALGAEMDGPIKYHIHGKRVRSSKLIDAVQRVCSRGPAKLSHSRIVSIYEARRPGRFYLNTELLDFLEAYPSEFDIELTDVEIAEPLAAEPFFYLFPSMDLADFLRDFDTLYHSLPLLEQVFSKAIICYSALVSPEVMDQIRASLVAPVISEILVVEEKRSFLYFRFKQEFLEKFHGIIGRGLAGAHKYLMSPPPQLEKFRRRSTKLVWSRYTNHGGPSKRISLESLKTVKIISLSAGGDFLRLRVRGYPNLPREELDTRLDDYMSQLKERS